MSAPMNLSTDLVVTHVEKDTGAGWLQWVFPAASNGTLRAPMRLALLQQLQRLEADEQCRYIVLSSSTPRVFSLDGNDEKDLLTAPTVQTVCDAIARCTKPTVALMSGRCYTTGLEMALCASYRLALEGTTWLSFSGARLAMLPSSVGGIQNLVRRAGVRVALIMLLTAEVVDAVAAEKRHLVDACWKEPFGVSEDALKTNDGTMTLVPSPESRAFVVKWMNEKMQRACHTNERLTVLDTLKEWAAIRMHCAWAAHNISISPLPYRIRFPYLLIDCVRIAGIHRSTAKQIARQAEALAALSVKCAALPEVKALEHVRGSLHRITQLSVPWCSSKPHSSTSASIRLPFALRSVAIVAEDSAAAAFIAATILNSKPEVEITVLCVASSFASTRPSDVYHQEAVRHQELHELSSAVMDYLWWFRQSSHPDGGRHTPAGEYLRRCVSRQLRWINVPYDHADGTWSGVPTSFYESDLLIECSFPWSSLYANENDITASTPTDISSSSFSSSIGDVPSVRHRRWRRLDSMMKPDALFWCATASTDLNVLSLAVPLHRPQLVGVFFAPRFRRDRGLVEVCATTHTEPTALHVSSEILHQISCVPAVVRSPICGYVLCRVFFAGLHQAHAMLLDGCFPIEVDRVMRTNGHRGLLAIEDLWGLDWCAAVRQRISVDLPSKDVMEIPRELVRLQKAGRRTGEGWFRYRIKQDREFFERNPSRKLRRMVPSYVPNNKVLPDPVPCSVVPLFVWSDVKVEHNRSIEIRYIRHCLATERLRRDVSEVEMMERIWLAMVREAVSLLSDRVVESSRTMDVITTFGLGFESWSGGLLYETDMMDSPKSLLYKMRLYTRALGDEVFKPPGRAIVDMASRELSIGRVFP